MSKSVFSRQARFLFVLLCCCIGLNVHARQDSPVERMPWTLRDHYTFGGELLCMDYAKDNAEWRVRVYEVDSETARMYPDVIIRDVAFSIELGDGRIITHDMLGGNGETVFGRDAFTSEHFGEGTAFSVQFVPYEGISVEHKVSRFRSWNFLLVSITVANNSENPVSVTRIQPAIVGGGAMSGFSETAHVNNRHYIFRGGHPVFIKEGRAATMRVYDPGRNASLALGILPSGDADSSIDIQSGGGAWQGRIECSYAPGRVLPPGASLESDPLWFCMDAPPVVADAQYAWLLRHYCRTDTMKHAPRAWVTIPDTNGLAALRREAADARATGISHALIPGNWEGRPGSHEGGAPQYPRKIGDAARSLRDAGAVPGITLDPLLADSGSNDFTAQSVDGRGWVNLGVKDGRAYAVKRMRRLADSGFGFFVIEESQIPDEALRAFNLTRAQAQTLAFDVVYEAVASLPVAVFPAAVATLETGRDEWLEAAGALSRMAELTIAPGPVRIRLGKESVLDAETMLALRFWRGPIEFMGAPPRSMQSKVSEILSGKPLVARPQDAYRRNPLTWLMRYDSSAIGNVGATILSFTGAEPWNMALVELFGGEGAPGVLWHPENNKPLVEAGGVLPAVSRFITHGLLANMSQPLFAGTTEEITLGLNRLKRLDWNGERNTLTGVLEPAPGVSNAFFFMPADFTLRSARVNSKQTRPVVEGQWITLPVGSGGGAFELTFETR